MKPIEQKEIDFQGGKITAVMVQDENGRENVYIPLRPLVEGMGLSWSGARGRIKRNPVLNEVCMSVRVTRSDIAEDSKRPKTSSYLSIPISHLNGFLFGVNANRVKPEIRPLLVEYQHKCYEALFQAFNGTESMERFYSAIGHDETWIAARIKEHHYYTTLSDVWLLYGVPIERHNALQDLINKGTFGKTVAEHKKHKNVPEGETLQDHMTGAELLISALAEHSNIIYCSF